MLRKSERNVYGNVQRRLQNHNTWARNKRGTKQRRKLEPFKCLFNFLVDYCNRSSLHGLKYIVEPGTRWIDRVIWALVFTLSVVTMTVVISKLSARFQEAQTSTVVETTNYPVSDLPFPSVTLCPSNRVDWQKALEMEKDIVPTHDLKAVRTYRELVTTLSTITFGDFDRLEYLKSRSLAAFRGMNLTQFLRNLAPECSELLADCWWRDSDRNCCEVFEPQGTEYGLCYSFNSETAYHDKAAYAKELRPRRSNSMGDWTGIRFTVKLNRSRVPPGSDKAVGVVTFVGHPNSWPSSGRNTGLGMLASISVQCPSTYATDRVLQLEKSKLPCRPSPDDRTIYNQDYCLTLCRRRHAINRCGCNPSFMMPAKGSAPECTIEDLVCLSNNNALFNKYVLKGNPFFPGNDLGMNCSCPPQCELYNYKSQITHTALRDSIIADTVFVDVYYESTTMMRYRMDIVYTQLDLLVSFGGVVGLFLGGSILSLMELLYYLAIGLMSQAFRRSNRIRKPAGARGYGESRNELENPIPTVQKVLPLMDYHPNPSVNVRRY